MGANDISTAVKALLAELESQYRTSKATGTTKVTAQDMPLVLAPDECPHPEGLELRESVKAFLLEGICTGDRSHALQGATVALFKAGLNDEQVLSVLANSDHAMTVALDHRSQDEDKAMAFLWKQCIDAKPKALGSMATAEDFDDLSEPKVTSDLAQYMAPITRDELAIAKTHPRVLVSRFLYANIRLRLAAGGVGKTTLALFEAVTLALGNAVWGHAPEEPIRTVIVTREDGREMMVGRLREVMQSMQLKDSEQDLVLQRVRIVDLTGRPFRVSTVKNDMVEHDVKALDWLLALLKDFAPDWVIFDPMVSFGVGESRVNDAEQGLIEAARYLLPHINCCIEFIHHIGKVNSRAGTLDQYAGRGGSTLADGARMIAVLQPVAPDVWFKETGDALLDGESGMVMALPKLSYAPPQENVYIKRRGYSFIHIRDVKPLSPLQVESVDDEKLFEFIKEEFDAGTTYNSKRLEEAKDRIGLSRNKVRDAEKRLGYAGRITRQGSRTAPDAHWVPWAYADGTRVKAPPSLAFEGED